MAEATALAPPATSNPMRESQSGGSSIGNFRRLARSKGVIMPPEPFVADVPTHRVRSHPGVVAVPRPSDGAWRGGVIPAVAAELRDPRLYQIACLGGLLVFGVSRLDLEVRGIQAAVILLTVLVSQYAGTRLARSRDSIPGARSSRASRSASCCGRTCSSWRS